MPRAVRFQRSRATDGHVKLRRLTRCQRLRAPMMRSSTRRRIETFTMCHRLALVTNFHASTPVIRSRRLSWVRHAASVWATRHHQSQQRLAAKTAWTSSTTDSSTNSAKPSRAAAPRRRTRHAHESRTPSICHLHSGVHQPTSARRRRAHPPPQLRPWNDSSS